ncbi:MAG: helix-hairpin-helix domain-containing protein [Brumimicrobium sp.]
MSDRSWDEDLLIFSRKSRRGVFVLLFVFILIAVTPRIYRNYFLNNNIEPQYQDLLINTDQDKINKKDSDKQQPKTTRKNQGPTEYAYNIPSTPFDPNEYDFDSWKSIGFSDKQVQTIINYQNSGGVFEIKSDLKKLYVIDDELYNQLHDKIDLPDSIHKSENEISKPNHFENNTFEAKAKESIVLNVNRASTEELQKINGIGPFFAEEIVKLREEHGGIYDLNQLLDIYNFDEEKLEELKPHLKLNIEDIDKININKATKKMLGSHPDIDWNIANSIVSMRETHGEYKSLDDLLKSVLIDKQKLEEIRPYLTVD